MQFPILSSVVRQILVALATSAEAERTFSAAGIICDDKRSMLSQEMVDSLVFLARNHRLVNWNITEWPDATDDNAAALSGAPPPAAKQCICRGRILRKTKGRPESVRKEMHPVPDQPES